jgi:hypothetical protein
VRRLADHLRSLLVGVTVIPAAVVVCALVLSPLVATHR